LRSSASGDKTEERIVDGIIYIQLPKRVAGKSWIAIDSKKVPGLALADLSQSQSDPGQYLTFLGGVTDDFTKVGTEVVRRERTTHYHGVVNVGKAVQDASLPAVLRDRLSVYAPGPGNATFPLEVWIDAEGRARKIRTVRSVAAIVGRRRPGLVGGHCRVLRVRNRGERAGAAGRGGRRWPAVARCFSIESLRPDN
jgi:hypothetical protein